VDGGCQELGLNPAISSLTMCELAKGEVSDGYISRMGMDLSNLTNFLSLLAVCPLVKYRFGGYSVQYQGLVKNSLL
jgi:hypothetical protein